MKWRRSTQLRRSWVASLQACLRAFERALRGAPDPGGATKDNAVAEAAPLRQALKQLLDLHPASRRLMRHLAYVERTLTRQGLGALDAIPVEVVTTALTQLDAIVSNWSDGNLADLRSRMAVAIKRRSEDAFAGPAGAQRSDFATASRLLVGDVAHSVFEELQRQYQGLLPDDRIQALLAADAKPAASTLPG
jgi:hypothetical protein